MEAAQWGDGGDTQEPIIKLTVYPSMDIPQRRTAKACVICHKKKIKCELIPGSGNPCGACVRDGYECRARERKRKRIYSLDDESPAPRSRRSKAVHQSNGTETTATSSLEIDPLLSHGTTTQISKSSNNDFELPQATIKVAHQDSAEPSPIPSAARQRPNLSYAQSNVSYLGRSEYIGDGVPINDEEEAPSHSTRGLSEKDLEILQVQRVFDLPPPDLRETLVQSYWARIWPWTPIVDRSWLEGRPENEISILLQQSMMLAGSRVCNSTVEPGALYDKAKMLFWMGIERDPMIMTVAALLLNWWNPEGPEHYSIDTSGFWVRIAVGLAYQLGLHRDPGDRLDASLRKRLWWSLLVRDSLINAGHGRPRAISQKLTDVPLPTVDDFGGDVLASDFFSAHIDISMILGDLTQCFLEKGKISVKRQSLGDRCFRWIKTLPEPFQLFQNRSLRPYHFDSRQLHVQYFTTLCILNRSTPPTANPSTASLIAASFIAGICHSFLEHDEIGALGSIFTFYTLTAGATLLSSYSFAGLWQLAEQDLNTIIKALEELGKRWPSAHGSLWRIKASRAKLLKNQRSSSFPKNNLTKQQMQFFESFGPELCRSWNVLYPDASAQHSATRDLVTADILTNLYSDSAHDSADATTLGDGAFDAQLLNAQMDSQWSTESFTGMGNWLFNDWQEPSYWP